MAGMDGIEVRNLRDLEIGDVATQARMYGLRGVDHDHLHWLRRVGNKLAHSDIVSWATAQTSRVALRIADFRE